MMKISQVMKIISYWPPFLGAGIKVKEYDLDAGHIKVQLKRTPLNGNAFGTHFGGSLFAMCDPWFVFLAIHHLGSKYIVWDLSAEIDFVMATKEPVFASFQLGLEDISTIKQETEGGEKYCPEFPVEICTATGELVAKVKKRIYVRKKKPKT